MCKFPIPSVFGSQRPPDSFCPRAPNTHKTALIAPYAILLIHVIQLLLLLDFMVVHLAWSSVLLGKWPIAVNWLLVRYDKFIFGSAVCVLANEAKHSVCANFP